MCRCHVKSQELLNIEKSLEMTTDKHQIQNSLPFLKSEQKFKGINKQIPLVFQNTSNCNFCNTVNVNIFNLDQSDSKENHQHCFRTCVGKNN